MTAETAAISVKDLTLEAGGKLLLEKASFDVKKGEVVLLVGLSGSGKSLTLKLLAGLIDRAQPGIRVDGRLELFGEDAAIAARKRSGIVFQDFGLFDEWSAEENIRFGCDHRRGGAGSAAESVRALAKEFRLEGAGRVATLSGGMKQRTAIARTLAFDPEIVFYDEPTSGLDPAMAAQVASRIRSTNDTHKKTSLVVTHDLASLAEIADRIILLDAGGRTFKETKKSDVERVLHELASRAIEEGAERSAPKSLAARMLAPLENFFAATGNAVQSTLATAWALLPRWPRIGWGARYLWYYLRMSSIGSAIGYVALAGFVLGVIVTYFAYNYMPFRKYTEPLVLDSLTGAIGYAIYRIMAPGMTSMLIAARSGAALAADIGQRNYSRQTDALRSFGVAPERYFLTNSLWAHALGTPLLTAVNFLAASLGSMVVFSIIHAEHSTYFWAREYTRLLIQNGGDYFEGTFGVWVKTTIASLGTAAIAYFQGMRPKSSGRDVSRAVTSTIIWCTLFVLFVHLAASIIEFRPKE